MKIDSQTIFNEIYLPVFKLGKRMSRELLLIVTSIVVSVIGYHQPADAQIIQLDPVLTDHIQEAMDNNPDLLSWQAKVDAAEKRVPQAGAWNDPTLTFSLMNLPVNTFNFNQEAMTGAWINLNQSVPISGKFKIRKQIAGLEQKLAIHNRQERELQIALDVTRAYHNWHYWRLSTANADITIRLLDDLTALATTKYETGRGLLQDLLRLQTERTRMQDLKVRFEQLATTASRQLAILLGREPVDLLALPDGFNEFFTALDRDELIDLLNEHNPKLKAAITTDEVSSKKVTLAKRLWWPDMKLGVGYGYRQANDEGLDRPDFFSVSAGITLPIFGSNKQGPAVAEMHALARHTEAAERNVELQLNLRLETLLDEDLRFAQQIRLYDEGILPQAEATLGAATASYSVGKVDVEALISAQLVLLNSRLERHMRIRDRLNVRAELAALLSEYDLISKK